MAKVSVFLSDMQAGRSSSTVQVRLIRFWETRNVRRDGDLMGVVMILLNSQVFSFTPPLVHKHSRLHESILQSNCFTNKFL